MLFTWGNEFWHRISGAWDLNPYLSNCRGLRIVPHPPHLCLPTVWRNSLLSVPGDWNSRKGWKSSKEDENEAETPASHRNQAIMFYFHFPERIVQLHSDWKTRKKHNQCLRNVKYYILANVYRTIKRLNIPKQTQTFTKVSFETHRQGVEREVSVCSPADFSRV